MSQEIVISPVRILLQLSVLLRCGLNEVKCRVLLVNHVYVVFLLHVQIIPVERSAYYTVHVRGCPILFASSSFNGFNVIFFLNGRFSVHRSLSSIHLSRTVHTRFRFPHIQVLPNQRVAGFEKRLPLQLVLCDIQQFFGPFVE